MLSVFFTMTFPSNSHGIKSRKYGIRGRTIQNPLDGFISILHRLERDIIYEYCYILFHVRHHSSISVHMRVDYIRRSKLPVWPEVYWSQMMNGIHVSPRRVLFNPVNNSVNYLPASYAQTIQLTHFYFSNSTLTTSPTIAELAYVD